LFEKIKVKSLKLFNELIYKYSPYIFSVSYPLFSHPSCRRKFCLFSTSLFISVIIYMQIACLPSLHTHTLKLATPTSQPRKWPKLGEGGFGPLDLSCLRFAIKNVSSLKFSPLISLFRFVLFFVPSHFCIPIYRSFFSVCYIFKRQLS